MRKLILLGVLLALAAGCKKPAANVAVNNAPPPQGAQPNQFNQPNVHAPTGVVTNPNLGGGGGGTAQAVRKAAKRSATQNDLNQLRLFIDSYSTTNGQMPTRDEVANALNKEAPHIYKLWTDGVIEVTGAKQRESIWAYTKEDQSTTGEHLVLTNEGVARITPEALKERLKGQQ